MPIQNKTMLITYSDSLGNNLKDLYENLEEHFRDAIGDVCFAFIGAVVFLGTSMSAPLTALCLVVEFTHRGATLLVPTTIALGLGVGASRLWTQLRTRRAEA